MIMVAITFNGQLIDNHETLQYRLRNRHIGLCPFNLIIFLGLKTILENMALPFILQGHKLQRQDAKAFKTLELFGPGN